MVNHNKWKNIVHQKEWPGFEPLTLGLWSQCATVLPRLLVICKSKNLKIWRALSGQMWSITTNEKLASPDLNSARSEVKFFCPYNVCMMVTLSFRQFYQIHKRGSCREQDHFVPKSFFFSKIWTSLESELTHHRYIISTYPLNLLSYKTVLYFIVAYIQKSQKMKVEINSMISMLYQMHNLHTIYKSS